VRTSKTSHSHKVMKTIIDSAVIEQRQRGENERRDDNYNKKRSIHNLWVSLQMKGCGIITGAADCAAAGPRGRAVLRRLGDLIHLAIDVSPAEEK
jgi:hypothetical protein